MAIDLDGFAVLGRIADERHAFPDIVKEINRTARALILEQIKATSLTLAVFRGVRKAVGETAFGIVLDDMADKEIAALAGRLDRHGARSFAADAGGLRRHLHELASGGRDPAPKPARSAPAAKRSRKPAAAKRPFGVKSMSAVRET